MKNEEILKILKHINDPISLDSLFATIKKDRIKYNGEVAKIIKEKFIFYCIKYKLEIKHLKKITELNLSDTIGDHFELPPSIDVMVNLKKLVINNTRIVSLPESMCKLKKLERLSLNRNQIINLPNSIGKLKNLERLSLNDNQIISLPNSIGKLKKLKYLSLRNNRLSKLPSTINKLTNLMVMYLDNNELEELPFEDIGLTELTLNGNIIDTSREIKWIYGWEKPWI